MKKFLRDFEASMDPDAYTATCQARLTQKGVKLPKALDDALIAEGGRPAELVQEWREREMADLERKIAEQRDRLNKAEAKLAIKETKVALNDQRIAKNKIRQFEKNLEDLERPEARAEDMRIWPGVYSTVLIQDGKERLLRPMRYQCRMPGWNADMERKFPGTYNARRDNLSSSWKRLFGQQHGLVVAYSFYESVDRDGKSVELEFTPKTGDPILIPCLWSYDPRERFYSFAAITDDPEPEVLAAGHDRTIVNLLPEHVNSWLNPAGDMQSMHALFDAKRRPYYEHRVSE